MMTAGAQSVGWTDERVEILKKLWMDGLSASQIAGELGEGVTRNAVIGKVHRLKLSTRIKPTNTAPRSRPAPPQRATPRRVTPSGSIAPTPMTNIAKPRQMVMRTHSVGATALQATPDYQTSVYVAPPMEEVVIPMAQRLSLLQLTEQTCKWPIGDPVSAEFHFCGQHSEDGKPYCEFHSRRAYHQIDKKRR